MKLSSGLLQSVALGVAIAAFSAACRQNDLNSGQAKQEKPQKGKKSKPARTACPTCGMG